MCYIYYQNNTATPALVYNCVYCGDEEGEGVFIYICAVCVYIYVKCICRYTFSRFHEGRSHSGKKKKPNQTAKN